MQQGLGFVLSLHLHPYFEHASNKISSESAHIHLLLDNATSAKKAFTVSSRVIMPQQHEHVCHCPLLKCSEFIQSQFKFNGNMLLIYRRMASYSTLKYDSNLNSTISAEYQMEKVLLLFFFLSFYEV